MSSVSGRIGSAQALRNFRRSSAGTNRAVTSARHSRTNLKDITEESFEPKTKEIEALPEKNKDEEEPFKLLTKEKIKEQNEKIRLRKKKLKEKKSSKKQNLRSEGKLVDGEIIYDNTNDISDEESDDEAEKDITLTEGNPVPERFGKVPKELIQKPLEEIDLYIKATEESFIIISKRITKPYIYRFSPLKSLFLFSPLNPIRKIALFIATWQFFDYFMILTILTNCIFMAIQLDDNSSNIIEYTFTSIYTVEMIIKILSKGFVLHPYSYLRDTWNWLDSGVLILSYVTILIDLLAVNNSVNLSALRAFRVFRAFKTVNIISGLKTIVNAILKSLVMFLEVMILLIFILAIFSLFSLQVFRGALSQKCVATYNSSNTNKLEYSDWIKNENNWFFDKSIVDYALCSNGSDTNEGRKCPSGYTCLRGIGQNPNNGITNFDNFGFAMIVNFQVISLDHWEDVYNRVIDSMGPWNFFYFLPIVFMGSFYIINLMLAVVTLAYETESENAKKRLEAPAPKKNTIVYDINTLKAKMEEKAREIENRKRQEKEKQNKKNSVVERNIIKEKSNADINNTKNSQIGFSTSLGESTKEDDNETANIEPIKLSENMGKLNQIIEEGEDTCHFHGEELVIDNRNCYPCLKLGKYYLKWLNIQNFVFKIVTSIYFELFIIFCIIVNTIVMTIQYADQPASVDLLQDVTNYIIFVVFVCEAILKILAYNKQYFLSASNWFDLVIIALSIVDLSVPSVQGLSVFRTLRLLQIFKLAKTWKTMRKIIVIVLSSMSSIGYLSLILFIVIYIFAIIGMDLFQQNYIDYYHPNEMPRSHFLDIWHSLLMILRILCGECIEPMIECWAAAGPICLVVFYPTVLFGNFIILNLFLAMLLDAFDAESMSAKEEDDETTKQLKKLKDKFMKCFNSIKIFCKRKCTSSEVETTVEIIQSNENFQESTNSISIQSDSKKSVELVNCLPDFCYKRVCKCCNDNENKVITCWIKFRKFAVVVIEHNVFEGFIIICILISSLLLAFEDVYLKTDSTTYQVLRALDYTFQAMFLTEMIIKWIGYGLKKYFTDWWCILDFIIVMLSLIDLILTMSQTNVDLSFLKVLRTLRALRPLRAISKWEGMRIVVTALGNSIPAIFNVFVVCLMFWLIFSIMGVTLFKGKFYKCVDSITGFMVNVSNKSECLSKNGTMWYNSKINFDNVANGYLALFQLATFEGWQEIIRDGVDSTDIGQQPSREANMAAYAYFVVFIILGAFFTLNLFIGVIIDNFNMLKKKYEGGVIEMFLTPKQKAYFQTMKNMGKKKPQKSIKRPDNKIQGFIYDVIVSTKFQICISIVIVLNMAVLAIQYYKQPMYMENILNVVDTVFVTIYGLEVIFKLIAFRQHFFRSFWNVYDFLVTLLAIFSIPFQYYFDQALINPLIFYVVRIFRVFRVLRFVKAAKGIRKLLFALLISLPALFNVGTLLFLIMFIYSIIGMNFFMNIQLQNSLSPTVNFQTFGKSFLLLFRVGTISGWNDVLGALMLTENDPGIRCNSTYDLQSLPLSEDPVNANGCGNTGIGIAFLLSYVFIVRLIMINMYIAVILENYNQAHQQEEVGITEDDFDAFYVAWEKYDPHATQFIKLDQLSDLINDMDQPLGISKPNDMAITSFNLPIVKNDLVHCLDVLHGLAKYNLGSIEDSEEFKEVLNQIDAQFIKHFPLRVHHTPVTTTIHRKKMEIAARTLQRAWRQFKLHKTIQSHSINNKN